MRYMLVGAMMFFVYILYLIHSQHNVMLINNSGHSIYETISIDKIYGNSKYPLINYTRSFKLDNKWVTVPGYQTEFKCNQRVARFTSNKEWFEIPKSSTIDIVYSYACYTKKG
jgi:hypothetical protein